MRRTEEFRQISAPHPCIAMVELQRLVGAHLGFDCRTLLGISLRGIKEREILLVSPVTLFAGLELEPVAGVV